MSISRFCGWLLMGALFLWLGGCKKAEETSSPAPPGDVRSSVQQRLNDPNVSPQEKEQIRRHYGEGK